MDVKVVNPCPDEIAKLKAAGLSVVGCQSEGVRQGCRTFRQIRACRSCSPTTCAPTCRKTWSTSWSKAFYKNRDALAKLDPGFTPMAKDFVGMQVQRHQRQSGDPGACRPRQVPEGTQGLGRQVEDRDQREADRRLMAQRRGCVRDGAVSPRFVCGRRECAVRSDV